MKSKDLEDRAKECGYSYHTIRRAKDEMKASSAVRYRKEGGAGGAWIVELIKFSKPATYAPIDFETLPFKDEPMPEQQVMTT